MDTAKHTEVEEISLSPKQLARRLGVSEGTIYRWNQTPGTGPRILQDRSTPNRAGVRYKLSNVREWEDSRTVKPDTTMNERAEAVYERISARG
jgi:predicted DNA-binding transcriptional regulator AlpA